ncbi:hypothetical protein AMTRI_Chr08g207860 [Amborella trichopoda]
MFLPRACTSLAARFSVFFFLFNCLIKLSNMDIIIKSHIFKNHPIKSLFTSVILSISTHNFRQCSYFGHSSKGSNRLRKHQSRLWIKRPSIFNLDAILLHHRRRQVNNKILYILVRDLYRNDRMFIYHQRIKAHSLLKLVLFFALLWLRRNLNRSAMKSAEKQNTS